MQQDPAIAHVIQLSVAPVFLMAGIGAMLSVMTNRLARIVDRAREWEQHTPIDHAEALVIKSKLDTLSRRAKLAGWAITLVTMTAVLICAVIALLFLSAFLVFDAYVPVALLFITAMLCFLVGLVWFLREILLATVSLRIGPHKMPVAASSRA